MSKSPDPLLVEDRPLADRFLVAYQAIRTYLKDYRGIDIEMSHTESTETALTSIEKVTGRFQTVTDQRLTDVVAEDSR